MVVAVGLPEMTRSSLSAAWLMSSTRISAPAAHNASPVTSLSTSSVVAPMLAAPLSLTYFIVGSPQIRLTAPLPLTVMLKLPFSRIVKVAVFRYAPPLPSLASSVPVVAMVRLPFIFR